MRNVAIALGLVFVAGCGTNVAGGVSLAQARATCLAWDRTVDAGANFDSTVLLAEALRDDGTSEREFLGAVISDGCQAGDSGCISCITQVAAAVWN